MPFFYNPYERETGKDWNYRVAGTARLGHGFGKEISDAGRGISDIQARQGLGAAAKVGASGQTDLQKRSAIGDSGSAGLRGAATAAQSRLGSDITGAKMDVGQWQQMMQSMYSQQQIADQRSTAYQQALAQIEAAKKAAENQEDAAMREGMGGMFFGLGGLAGGIAQLSDERMKTDIKEKDMEDGKFSFDSDSAKEEKEYDYLQKLNSSMQQVSKPGLFDKAVGIAGLASLSDPKAKKEMAEVKDENAILKKLMMSNYGPEQQIEEGPGYVDFPETQLGPARGDVDPVGLKALESYRQSGGFGSGDVPRKDRVSSVLGTLGRERAKESLAGMDYRMDAPVDPDKYVDRPFDVRGGDIPADAMMYRNPTVERIWTIPRAEKGGMRHSSLIGPTATFGGAEQGSTGTTARDMWEMYPGIKPSPGEEKQFYGSIRDHYWAPPGGGGSLLPKYMPFPTSEMPRLGYEGGTTALRAAEAQRREQLLAELDELEAIGSGTTPAYRAGVGGPPWRE